MLTVLQHSHGRWCRSYTSVKQRSFGYSWKQRLAVSTQAQSEQPSTGGMAPHEVARISCSVVSSVCGTYSTVTLVLCKPLSESATFDTIPSPSAEDLSCGRCHHHMAVHRHMAVVPTNAEDHFNCHLQAVIGAGAAGLAAARELRAEGHQVVVYEQGPGGAQLAAPAHKGPAACHALLQLAVPA
jgi:hypothetical protein